MILEVLFEAPWLDWGWKIGVYIALIGIASGAYLTGYAADVLSYLRDEPRHGAIAKHGYLVGLVGLAIGPPIMLSHLATPFRAMMVPLTMSNLGSWMAIGAWMMMVFALGTGVLFLWTAFGREHPHRHPRVGAGRGASTDGGRDVASAGVDATGGIRNVANRTGLLNPLDRVSDVTRPSEPVRLAVGGVISVFAFGVLLYSAMAFGSGPTGRVALWDKTFLIPVQISGGLGVGLASAVGLTAIADRQVGPVLRKHSIAAGGILAVSLLSVLATIVLLPEVRPGAEPAVANMLTTYTLEFVGLAVVVGLVVPIALLIGTPLAQRREALSTAQARASYFVAGLLAIVGKITLALIYLLAAEFVPLPLPA